MYELVAFLGKVMASRYGETIDDVGWFCFGILVALGFLVILGAVRTARYGDGSPVDPAVARAAAIDLVVEVADQVLMEEPDA